MSLKSKVWTLKNKHFLEVETYHFSYVQKIPLDLSIWAILQLKVFVDQGEPKEATRHVDKDGLLKTFSEVDGGRLIPIGCIDWTLQSWKE